MKGDTKMKCGACNKNYYDWQPKHVNWCNGKPEPELDDLIINREESEYNG
jgi:hypothetical protein